MKLLAPIKNDEDIVNKKYVDSIDIGSRNIVTGTDTMTIGSMNQATWENKQWRQSGTGTIETIDITETIVPSVNKGAKLTASSTEQIGICQDLIPLNNNNIYTLSCWVRGSSSGLTCKLQPFYASSTDTGGIKSFTLTGEWQYLNYTANKPPQNTTNYNGAYIYLIPNAAGDTLEVCGIKLERGDKATDWSPAPEDVDTAISNVTNDFIKELSESKRIITYTKGNGLTGTIDTTYSAGTGLSLSGTTFNHKNSVTADTAQGDASKTLTFGGTFTIPTVTYDAQGHIISKGTTTMTMPTNPNTDTKVTSVGNHYTPSADSSAALSASASGATAAWGIDVVKGVTLQRDAKGHVTGVSVTSGKIPANPNTDTKVTQTVTTSNASYPLLLAPNGQTATATTTAYFNSGVTLNPSTNTIAANISGSSTSCTGNAATATKLATSAGSATQPVYFSDGKPVSCTYTLGKSVPNDAVFTDTKVTNTLATTTKAYITGTTTATTSTDTQVFDTGVYLDDKAGNLTATQFNGKLNGNATSATKATQDSAGQQINTTYIKDVSISGTNLSYTKGDSTVTTTTINDILSGSALTSNSTTATTTKGYSYGVAGVTTSPYNYTKWYAYLDSGITTLTNGMIIKMRIPVAGCNYGTCIAINGSDFHPVVFNTNSVVTTHYGVGVELLLMYDSNGSAKVYSNSATSAAISGVWRVMNNYNSNTTNTAGSTNTSSKIFLVGATSQTTYAQTYSNSKVYVDTDSCLYSNGKKVSVEGHTHSYLPLTGGTIIGNNDIPSVNINSSSNGTNYPYGYIDLYSGGSIAGNIFGRLNNTNGKRGIVIRPQDSGEGAIGDGSHYFGSAYINNLDKVTMIKSSGDVYHKAERTDLTFKDSNGDTQHEDIRFGISNAGNRGIWDRRSGSWLTYFITGSNNPITKGAFAVQEGRLTIDGTTETFTSKIPFTAGRNYMYIYTSRIPKLFNKIRLVNNESKYLASNDNLSFGYTIVNTSTEKYIKLKGKKSGSGTPSNPSWDYIVFFCTL